MGSLIYKNPITVVYFNVRNFSLCGIPFFSGFYSKDLIMEFYSIIDLNLFVYIVSFLSLGLTVSYRIRLVYYLIFNSVHFSRLRIINEIKNSIIYSIGLIFFIVLFSGRIVTWLIMENLFLVILPIFIKLLTLLIVFIGIILGYEISKFNLSNYLFFLDFINLLNFNSLIWNINYITSFGLNYYVLKNGNLNIKFMDLGWLEFIGSQGLFSYLKNNSLFLQYLFNNNLKIFLVIFLGWVFLLFINFYLNSLY